MMVQCFAYGLVNNVPFIISILHDLFMKNILSRVIFCVCVTALMCTMVFSKKIGCLNGFDSSENQR